MRKANKNHQIWTLETCKASASTFTTRTEWAKADRRAYEASKRNGWFDPCTEHMSEKFAWNKEECMRDALAYTSRGYWQIGNVSAYNAAHRNGWLEQCCAHMELLCRRAYTKEECLLIGKRYKSSGEWRWKDRGSYGSARNRKWITEACEHMKKAPRFNSRSDTFTLKECIADAKKFKTKLEWKRRSKVCYKFAEFKLWVDRCCKHQAVSGRRVWDKESLKKEAAKYSSRTNWFKESVSSYTTASKMGILDECCLHMNTPKRHPRGYWTLEKCIEVARQYSTIGGLRINDELCYQAMIRNQWHEECSQYLRKEEAENVAS